MAGSRRKEEILTTKLLRLQELDQINKTLSLSARKFLKPKFKGKTISLVWIECGLKRKELSKKINRRQRT